MVYVHLFKFISLFPAHLFIPQSGTPHGPADYAPSQSSTNYASDAPFSLHDIVQGPPTEPTLEALQSYMDDLEREVRNFDFRLQYLYHARSSTLDLFAEASRQADKLKKEARRL